jgi:TRAP-type C4-dicarboxylate transport system permease small subunit
MKRIQQIFIALALVFGVGVAFVPAPVYAIDVIQKGCEGQTSDVCTSLANDKAPDMVKDIINTMLFVLGIIAVIMIIIGGIRYVVSAGDSSAITAAKNTILYAVIGLVVAILAFAIVNFVVGAFK